MKPQVLFCQNIPLIEILAEMRSNTLFIKGYFKLKEKLQLSKPMCGFNFETCEM